MELKLTVLTMLGIRRYYFLSTVLLIMIQLILINTDSQQAPAGRRSAPGHSSGCGWSTSTCAPTREGWCHRPPCR
ncbi:hypothetical protein SORBI_3005G205150 [Sorghum bicolor]|uniref:Uncharacterized protein n=1 Tax=Sorghum bicolor TaxID=4558 RepID=A0A1Z5RKP7_SORBI|nr:hypothetical protein SORBI_3005G205150 [Sorghum bicolor]